jgi:hypothetical protein
MDFLTIKFEKSSTTDNLDWDTFDAPLLLNEYSNLDKSMQLQWLQAQVATCARNGRLIKFIEFWVMKQQWIETP